MWWQVFKRPLFSLVSAGFSYWVLSTTPTDKFFVMKLTAPIWRQQAGRQGEAFLQNPQKFGLLIFGLSRHPVGAASPWEKPGGATWNYPRQWPYQSLLYCWWTKR
jgi:hypothetical protein